MFQVPLSCCRNDQANSYPAKLEQITFDNSGECLKGTEGHINTKVSDISPKFFYILYMHVITYVIFLIIDQHTTCCGTYTTLATCYKLT